MMARWCALLIALLMTVPVAGQIRWIRTIAGGGGGGGSTPISANEHPRLGMCLNSYSGTCPTRAEVRTKINNSAMLRTRLDEVITYLDGKYATHALVLTGCTVANPSVCTSDVAHDFTDGWQVYIAGTTGYSPNLDNGTTGYYVDALTTTTFALYSNVGLTTGINVTGAGTGGYVAYVGYAGNGQVMDELAFAYGFIAQILTVGTITGATPDHAAAEYGARAAGTLALVIAARSPSPGYAQETYFYQFAPVIAYDWAYEWMTASQRTTAATYLRASEATDHWTSAPAWNNGAIPMRGYILAAAAGSAGDGIHDAWATSTLATFAAKVCCDLTSSVRSWSEHGEDTSASIIEGTNYFAYSGVASLVLPEVYRTANAIAKATFYTSSNYAKDLYLPIYMLHATLPWATTHTGHMDNLQRPTVRSHYSYIWRENTVPSEIFRVSPVLSAGIVGFLDSTMAGLAMWYQENRTIYNSKPGYGGNTIAGPYVWILRALFGDESISAITPTTVLGHSTHMAENIHSFREHLTDDNGYAVNFYTTKYTTGTARGREATQMTGVFTIDRKGAQVIIRGNNSHTGGDVSGMNRMCFTRKDRVRRDTYPTGSLLDDLGCVRGFEGIPDVTSANDFGLTGAQYSTGIRTSDEDTANGRYASYVHADVTTAYPTSATSTTINPTVTSAAKIDFLVIRGASSGDPVRVVRRDFGTLTDTTNFERVLPVNLAAEPTYNESGTVAGPARKNGVLSGTTAHCRTTMTGATQITSTNTIGSGSPYTNNGKTRVNILWPTSTTVIKTGGANESGKKYYNKGAGNADTSCEMSDYSGTRHAVVDDVSKIGNGATSGNVTGGSGGGHNLDYTAYGAGDVGHFYTEIIDTTGAASGNFYLTYEVGDSTITPRTVAALTGLTNVLGHVETSGTDRYVVVMSDTGNVSQTSGGWTIGVDNTTAYTMVVTGFNPSSNRTLSCTNTTSFTQVDPTDTDGTYLFDAAGVAVFTFTSSSTSVACTVT